MDKIIDENTEISKSNRLKKSDLLELRKRQSKMIREQSTSVPVYQAPELNLEDILGKNKTTTQIPFNRKLIMEVLREAGVDVSKQVTLNKNSYENTFKSFENESINKLIQHNKDLDNLEKTKITCRNEFRKRNKDQLEQSRKDRHLHQQHYPLGSNNWNNRSSDKYKTKQKRVISNLEDVEADLWNKDQKLEEYLNEQNIPDDTKVAYNKKRSSEQRSSMEEDLCSEQFPVFDCFQDISENIPLPSFLNKNTDDESDNLVGLGNNIKMDEYIELPMLCSGKFFTQDCVNENQNQNIAAKKSPTHSNEKESPFEEEEAEQIEQIEHKDPIDHELLKQSLMDNYFSINNNAHKTVNIQTNDIKTIDKTDEKSLNKFNMKDFFEDEAEQSGDDVSLGSEGNDVSDLGSLADFISEHEEVDASINDNDEINARQAHLNDILLQDKLEIEAIQAIHFPSENNCLNPPNSDIAGNNEQTTFDDEEREALILNANHIPDDNNYSDSNEEDNGDNNIDNGINRIRSRLINGYSSSFHDNSTTLSSFHPTQDDNAILPDYVSDPNNLLNRIQTPQRIAINLSNYENNSSMTSFIHSLKSKGVQSIEPSLLNLKNTNSACVFISSDSHHSNPAISKSASNDTTKLGEYKKDTESRNPTIPTGSIFSFLKPSSR